MGECRTGDSPKVVDFYHPSHRHKACKDTGFGHCCSFRVLASFQLLPGLSGHCFSSFTQFVVVLLLSHFSRVRLCDPIDGSPPGSPVPGILQARTLEWVAISFTNAWKWKVKVRSLSHIQLLATPWTAAHQAPPSMGFSRQEYWSGVPFLSPMHGSEKWKWSRSVVSDS